MSFEHFAAVCGLHARAVPAPDRAGDRRSRARGRDLDAARRGQDDARWRSVALHHLVTVERARVYCAAASGAQARILYEYARGLRPRTRPPAPGRAPPGAALVPGPRASRAASTRYLRVLGGRGDQAARPHLLAGVPGRAAGDRELDMYVALATALHKQPDSKMVVISTAGQGADSPLGRLRARALAQRSQAPGPVMDARTDRPALPRGKCPRMTTSTIRAW